jgi:TctA family transporter
LKTLGSSYLAIELPAEVLIYAIAVLIVVHFGLIPLASAIFTVDLLVNVPFTADFSAWYASSAIFILLSVVALAAWGFYNSLGGAPLWNLDSNERLKV